MARYRGPKLRIIRRLGELPGLTQKPCSRNFPPGQHGPKKVVGGGGKTKDSQYAVRLKEKQKLRFNYGITEKQLIKYVREARRRKGSTGEILLQLLETRLDNIVFRLGFTNTIAAARQLITHGHIVLNGKPLTIPSYLCQIDDTVAVSEKSRKFVKNLQRSGGSLPTHLEVDLEKYTGKVKGTVPRDSVAVSINELLIVEYYSRKV
jgi:small subunit ribosomal protein S4